MRILNSATIEENKKQNKRDKIRNYFLNLDKDGQEKDVVEIIDFVKEHGLSFFPYDFSRKYISMDVDVCHDEQCNMGYVLTDNNKRLYFYEGNGPGRVKTYYSKLCMEQDEGSPHRYETPEFSVKDGDVIVDVGAAEGIWALKNVEKASKIYLFECDERWIKALEKTFAPWKEKVVIVKKYVSDIVDEKYTTLDEIFNGQTVDFIKADIESYEPKMLEGAKETLKNNENIKLSLCTYHKKYDAAILKEFLETRGFITEFSKRYMLFVLDDDLEEPYIRRGLIRARKG